MVWGQLAAAAAGGLLGAYGSYRGAQEAAAAQRRGIESQEAMYRDMVNRLEEIGIPTEEATKLVLEQYGRPEELDLAQIPMEDVIRMGPSAFEQVTAPDQMQQVRMDALRRLQEIQDYGGLDPMARAQIEQSLADAASFERSQRAGLQQAMQRRGMAGSGLEFAGAMAAGQSAADRARQEALQTGALAQQRALDAMMAGEELAGTMSREDVQRQQQQARAMDTIARFNAEAMRRAQEANIQAQRESQLKNWATAQEIAMKNVDLRNKMAEWQAGAPKRRFENEMAKWKALKGPQAGIGEARADLGSLGGLEKAAKWEALGKLGTLGGTLGYEAMKEPRKPTLTGENKMVTNPFGRSAYEAEEADIFGRDRKTWT